MKLYDLLSKIFPRSFLAKVILIAFVGVHVPLLGFIGFLFARTGTLSGHFDLFLAVLAATLVGTMATVVALGILLAPVRAIMRTLDDVVHRRETSHLPEGYSDELGQLMSNLNRMIRGVEQRLDAATQRAEMDALTGLLNRSGFERLVPEEGTGAMLFLDIDHFKTVNDVYGHAAGDDALRDVARVAANSVRDGDVVARFGGEEFVVWLEAADGDEAMVIAERIRSEVERRVRIEDTAVTISVGLACRTELTPRGTLLSLADQAVYAAKAAGRNRVVLDGAMLPGELASAA